MGCLPNLNLNLFHLTKYVSFTTNFNDYI